MSDKNESTDKKIGFVTAIMLPIATSSPRIRYF